MIISLADSIPQVTSNYANWNSHINFTLWTIARTINIRITSQDIVLTGLKLYSDPKISHILCSVKKLSFPLVTDNVSEASIHLSIRLQTTPNTFGLWSYIVNCNRSDDACFRNENLENFPKWPILRNKRNLIFHRL